MPKAIQARNLKNNMCIHWDQAVYRTEHVQRGCGGHKMRVMRTVLNPLLSGWKKSLVINAEDLIEQAEIEILNGKVLYITPNELVLRVDGERIHINDPVYAKDSKLVLAGTWIDLWKLDNILIIMGASDKIL